MSLTHAQLTEAKRLYEDYERCGEYHDTNDSARAFLGWIEDHFEELLAWAGQEPMAHQLADADQALAGLEELWSNYAVLHHGDLSPHVKRLRTAIDGTDYARR